MKKLLLLLIIILPFTELSCQTFISGSVSGTWTKEGNPYFIIDDCQVFSGNTLKIEPGVEVLVGKDLSIEIFGLLLAEGSEAEPIIFRSPSDTVYWNQILIQNSASILKYCNISDANRGLYLFKCCSGNSTTTMKILNCNFNNCAEHAIFCHSKVDYHLFTHLLTLNPIILNCNIRNSEGGISFYGSSGGNSNYRVKIAAEIKNCLFENIKNNVVDCEWVGYIVNSTIEFSNNTIVNSRRGIYGVDPYNISISNSIFSNCTIGIERTGEKSGSIFNSCFYSTDSADFIGYPSSYGQVVMSNNNGDPCDIASNIYLDPEFSDTIDYYLAEESPCIDAGRLNEIFYDICLPPAGGTEINDIGKYGGSGSCGYLVLDVTPIETMMDAFPDTVKFTINNIGTGHMNWSANIPPEDSSWLKIVSDTSGINFDSILVATSFNPGINRSGKLEINAPGSSNSPVTILINQGNQLPDLSISSLSAIPTSIERGAIFEVNGQFRCQGNGASVASTGFIYLSEDSNLDPNSDSLLGYFYLPGIDLGETKSYSAEGFRIPVQFTPGAMKLIGIINPDSLILENNFTNNTRTASITIIPIRPPTGMELTGISNDIVSIAWEDNTDAENGYEVWRSDIGPVHESFERIYTVPANTTEFLDSTVLSDTLYYYKVRAVNSVEQSDFCEIQTIRTDLSGTKIIAWYPFSGNAMDSTGNGNDGIVMNATLSLDRDSANNRAYSFNGSDSYIAIGNGVKPDFPFAISAWILCEDFNDQDQVLVHTDSANYGTMIEITKLGKVVAGMGDGGKFVTYTTEVHLISLRNWHHLAVNYLSPNMVEVYVNGVLEQTFKENSISTLIYSEDDPGSIGLGAPDIFFDGKIDEVRIYDRMLTWTEIKLLSDYVRPEAPPVPMSIQLEPLSSSEIELNWLDIYTDELWYEIFRSEDPGVNFEYLDTIGPGKTHYLDAELANNTRYHYKVRALRPEGFTMFSDTISARTYDESVALAPNVHCCYGEEVPPLKAEGNELKWYSDILLTNQVEEGSTLITTHTMPGTYRYYVTQNYKGLRGSAKDVTLTIHHVPDLTILPYDEVVEQGSEVTLTASGGLIYRWYEDSAMLDEIDSTINVFPPSNMTYSVVGLNANACSDSASIPIVVLCDPCGNDNVYFDQEGTINHGCEKSNYRNNSNCSWTIIPSGAEEIYLKIPSDSFDVKLGDVLEVYDGLSSAGDLLGRFDNDNKPDGLISSGNSMFIKFTSDDDETGGGFHARYWIPVDVEDFIKGLDYEIYPNPARDQVIVNILNNELVGGRLEMIDMTGRTFHLVEGISVGEHTLDLSDRSQGTIILRIISQQKIIHEQIVKE